MTTLNGIPLALLSALVLPAVAQDGSAQEDGARAKSLPLIERAATLVGRDVESSEGRLGEIRDVYIGPDGRVLYYVLQTEGIRTRSQHFAVPAICLTPDPLDRIFRMDVSERHFDDLEGFDPDEEPWPAQALAGCCEAATQKDLPRRPTDGAPMQAGVPARPAVAWNLDALVGTTIEDPQGTELGRFAAIGLDLAEARIAFWILSTDGGSDLIVVPWEALILRMTQGSDDGSVRLILNVTDDQLERAPEFDQDDEDAWLRASDGDWLKRQYEHFGLPFLLYYERNGLGGIQGIELRDAKGAQRARQR